MRKRVISLILSLVLLLQTTATNLAFAFLYPSKTKSISSKEISKQYSISTSCLKQMDQYFRLHLKMAQKVLKKADGLKQVKEMDEESYVEWQRILKEQTSKQKYQGELFAQFSFGLSMVIFLIKTGVFAADVLTTGGLMTMILVLTSLYEIGKGISLAKNYQSGQNEKIDNVISDLNVDEFKRFIDLIKRLKEEKISTFYQYLNFIDKEQNRNLMSSSQKEKLVNLCDLFDISKRSNHQNKYLRPFFKNSSQEVKISKDLLKDYASLVKQIQIIQERDQCKEDNDLLFF